MEKLWSVRVLKPIAIPKREKKYKKAYYIAGSL